RGAHSVERVVDRGVLVGDVSTLGAVQLPYPSPANYCLSGGARSNQDTREISANRLRRVGRQCRPQHFGDRIASIAELVGGYTKLGSAMITDGGELPGSDLLPADSRGIDPADYQRGQGRSGSPGQVGIQVGAYRILILALVQL